MKQCYDNYSDKKTTDNNQVMIMIAIFTIFSGEDHSKTHIGGYCVTVSHCKKACINVTQNFKIA